MPEATNEPTNGIRDAIAVARRRKWLILVCVVTVVLTSVVATSLQTPRYKAESDLLIRQGSSSALLNPEAVQSAQNSRPLMENELGLARSLRVLEAATKTLGFEPDVTISANTESDIMTITATSTNAKASAAIANAYAAAFIDVRRASLVDEYVGAAKTIQTQADQIDQKVGSLQAERDNAIAALPRSFSQGEEADRITESYATRLAALDLERTRLNQISANLDLSAELLQGGGASIISKATVPTSPYAPKMLNNVAIAVLLGLLLGAAMALLFENLDTSLRTEEQLKTVSGLDVLAVIPLYDGDTKGEEMSVISSTDPTSHPAEAYRSLRTAIQFLAIDRPIRTVQMTSPRPGDGKTTTAANFAVAVARAGKRVVLVDCDLRNPRVHRCFGLSNEHGFTSLLLGEGTFEGVGQRIPGEPNLLVVPSGPIPPDPSELLSGKRAQALLASMAEVADLVVIDSPPVLAVSDPLVLSSVADGVILVASVGNSDRNQIAKALSQLRQVDSPLIGAVLNRFKGDSSTYGYGYGYGYGVKNTQEAAKKTAKKTANEPEAASPSLISSNDNN
jgi:non-specific protein-tyrosine kinase